MSATAIKKAPITASERSANAKAAWAKRKAAEAEAPTPELNETKPEPAKAKAPAKKVIHVHFLDEGATIAGKVWHKGEELRSEEGDPIWSTVTDREGNSILNMDEDEQWDRFGAVLYGQGPWPGRPYDVKARLDGKLVDPETGAPLVELMPHEIEELAKANKERGLIR